MGRTETLRVSLTPEAHAAIRKSAQDLGVTMSSWAAMRLGEAALQQQRVAGVFESMGRDLASMLVEADKPKGDS